MKKSSPKVLAVVMLSLIAVLMVLAGRGLFTGKDESGEEIPGAAAEIKTPLEEPVSKPIKLPLSPSESENFAYEQSLASSGAVTLNEVHETAGGAYLVFTSLSDSAPTASKNKCVGIAFVTADGTLEAVRMLETGTACAYICSKLTSDGLVCAESDGEKTFVFTVSYDLTSAELIEFNVFSRGKICALDSGFLLITEGAQSTVYYLRGNAIIRSGALPTGEVLEFYDFGTKYVFVISGVSGYSVLTLSTSLEQLSVKAFSGKRAVAVQPFVFGGNQKYIVVESSASGFDVVKYSADFTFEDSVSVGLAQSADVFMNAETIYILLHSTTDRLYSVGAEMLGYTVSSSDVFEGIKKFFCCRTYGNNFEILYSASNSVMLATLKEGMFSAENLALSVTGKAFLTASSVIYQKNQKTIGIIGI